MGQPGISTRAAHDKQTTALAPTSATSTGSSDRSKQLMVLQGGMAWMSAAAAWSPCGTGGVSGEGHGMLTSSTTSCGGRGQCSRKSRSRPSPATCT
jgi:hypothetical protein